MYLCETFLSLKTKNKAFFNRLLSNLKTYEFDFEEGDSSTHVDTPSNQHLNHDCTKDFLKVESLDGASSSEMKLCGNYKEFKEFYAKGNSFKLNLTTDDFLSRRGFLVKISPTAGKPNVLFVCESWIIIPVDILVWFSGLGPENQLLLKNYLIGGLGNFS